MKETLSEMSQVKAIGKWIEYGCSKIPTKALSTLRNVQ